MPVPNYGVVKGHVTSARPERDLNKPHYQVRLKAAGKSFQIPINVRSSEGAPELRFLIDEDFRHPLTASLSGVAEGFLAVPDGRRGPALDYVRGNLFDTAKLVALPHDLPGEDNDLNDKLDRVMRRAVNDDGIDVFVFGSRFPGGVHDVHMNQGNPLAGGFAKDNAVFQDGGVLVHFTRQDRWTAIFLAFQSQSFHTDDVTGHPVRVE
ncbi:MAG TPA: YukJ family protein, partial [Longimicrobium sp.]|nr:YukJ family protein [Longimicrobium sp.]